MVIERARKHVFRMLSNGILMLLMLSCVKKTVIVREIPATRHVNICVLGNSYTNDSFSYVPFILKEYGITCKIHIYYRGSGSLEDLDEQWTDDAPYGVASLDGKKHIRLHFSIDTRIDSRWHNEEVASASDIVALDRWDIISIQQVSSYAQFEETYKPYLLNVINKITTTCSYPFSLAWFMAYNRANDNANEESIATQKSVCDEYPFSLVFPVATTIFNCQGNSTLANLGDSKYKKMYASDNVHLQEGLPCYAASLAIVQTILQRCFHEGSVMGDKIRPTQDWISSIGGITPNGESIGITEENCLLAQKAALTAYEHPFEIIPVQ